MVQQKQRDNKAIPVLIHNAHQMEACFIHGKSRNISYVLYTPQGSIAYTGVDYYLRPFAAFEKKYEHPLTLVLDCDTFFAYAAQALKLGVQNIIYISQSPEQERLLTSLARLSDSQVWGVEKRPQDPLDLVGQDDPLKVLERLFTTSKTGE